MSLPVNFRQQDIAKIEAAVTYAMQIARHQLQLVKDAGLSVEGLNFLELGPGWDFGPGLILASAGAKVTVADRFLSGWQQDFHAPLYHRLAEEWDGPVDQLKAAAEGGYEATSLRRLQEPAEALVSIADGSIDFVFSNAVLEHIVDIGAVAAELSRITRVGGRAAHQIDMRYHRDFSRPLDHLALVERDFVLSAEDSHNEFGNRFRPSEFIAHFGLNGFEVVGHLPNEDCTAAYLEEFIPQLRSARSAYRDWPLSDLQHVCAQFLLEKLGPETASALRYRSGVAVEMARVLKARTLAAIDREPWAPSIPYDDHELRPASLNGPDELMWNFSSADIPPGDSMGSAGSQAVLLEDGKPLGPAHALHDAIRSRGGGRFSHWERTVYFSTSDGSSPRTNGRRYTLRVPRSGPVH